MYRVFNIDNIVGYNYQLYRNRSEIIDDIPLEFIKKHTFRLREPSSFDIEIPKFIGKEKKINPIFNKIKTNHQVIISSDDGTKERYFLKAKKEMVSNKNGAKKFTGYSFEKKLEGQRITVPEGNYQLMSDDVHIAKGILELSLENSGWRLGHVDEECRTEPQMSPITIPSSMFKDLSIKDVKYDTVLFDKAIDTSMLQPNSPLYLTIEYSQITSSKNGKKIKTENVFNMLDPLYTNATRIKATYCSQPGNRWGIKYEITLGDGVKEEQVHTLTNITNLDITIKEIKLLYETGKYEEVNMVQYPYFGAYDDNIYAVLKDLEGVFDCIFTFDTYNKVVNCYDKKSYGSDKGLYLSLDTNVLELNIEESDSIPNGMKVVGKEGVSIVEENIFGGDVIYNYDYYIKEGLIPEDMVDSWNRYLTYADNLREEWALLRSNRQLAKDEQISKSSKASSLGRRIANTKVLLAGYVENGDKKKQEETQQELTKLEREFNEVSDRINVLEDLIVKYEEQMGDVSGLLKRENATDFKGRIFTSEHISIFDDIEEIVSVSDSYYSTPYALYKHYEKDLGEKVVPIIDFNMDTPNLIKAIPKWNKVLCLGDLYEVDEEMERLLQQKKVRLLEIDYIPSQKRVPTVTFCNKDEKIDKFRNMSGAGRKQSQAVNTNNQFKNIWEDSIGSNNYVHSLRENGMTLVTNAIKSKSDSCVLDMGSAGIWVKNAEDDKKQVAITSGIIAITTDGWKTSDTAITPEFINADLLMGKIIAGENLYITSDDGGFYVGNTSDRNNGKKEDFGLRITQDGSLGAKERVFLGLETDSDGVRRAKLRLTSEADNSIVFDENGILNSNFYEVWDNISNGFPMTTHFPIDEGVTRIKEVKLKIRLQKYRGFTKAIGGGGTVGSSGPSSVNTSSEEGKHRHLMFKSVYDGELKRLGELGVPRTFANNTGGITNSPIVFPIGDGVINFGDLYTYEATGQHRHDMRHTHQIDTEHGHDMEMGIFEGTMPTNCSIRINGQTIRQNIGSDMELDITPYVTLGTDNVIEISSETNGRVALGVKSKMFTIF